MDKTAYFLAFDAHLNRQNLNVEPAAIERCRLYFYLLHKANQATNLTRLDLPNECIDYHLVDSLHLYEALKTESLSSLIDVGSGAGVPGILMKCLNPDIRLSVIDSVKKKMDFVNAAIQQLELSESNAIAERAEALGHDSQHREYYDCATARALGSQSYCLELCAPFVKMGGVVALLRSDIDETTTPDQFFETLGCKKESTHEYQLPGRDKAFRVEIHRKVLTTQEKFPRKPVQIKKRPL